MDTTDRPLTVVVTRLVRAGREDAFERAVREWIPTSIAFTGHQGVLMLRPAAGGREYGAVLRFQSLVAWEKFRDSAEYRAFQESLRDYLEAEPRMETASGLEAWFAPSSAAFVRVPPRWKQAVLTWLGVDLIALVLTYTLSPLTAGWPWLAGFLTFNAAVVAGLAWVVMPVLSRLARGWLNAHPETPTERTKR